MPCAISIKDFAIPYSLMLDKADEMLKMGGVRSQMVGLFWMGTDGQEVVSDFKPIPELISEQSLVHFAEFLLIARPSLEHQSHPDIVGCMQFVMGDDGADRLWFVLRSHNYRAEDALVCSSASMTVVRRELTKVAAADPVTFSAFLGH